MFRMLHTKALKKLYFGLSLLSVIDCWLQRSDIQAFILSTCDLLY